MLTIVKQKLEFLKGEYAKIEAAMNATLGAIQICEELIVEYTTYIDGERFERDLGGSDDLNGTDNGFSGEDGPSGLDDCTDHEVYSGWSEVSG